MKTSTPCVQRACAMPSDGTNPSAIPRRPISSTDGQLNERPMRSPRTSPARCFDVPPLPRRSQPSLCVSRCSTQTFAAATFPRSLRSSQESMVRCSRFARAFKTHDFPCWDRDKLLGASARTHVPESQDYFSYFEKVYGASGVMPALDGTDRFRLRKAMSPAYSRGRLKGLLGSLNHHARKHMAGRTVGDSLSATSMSRLTTRLLGKAAGQTDFVALDDARLHVAAVSP